MKKIGIIGGLAWPSTIDYYRLICAGANTHFRALGADLPLPVPPIMIESVNMAETRKLRGNADAGEAGWAAFDDVFRVAFQRLQAAGCDFGLIASNTPHARLHAIRDGLEFPVVSILEEVTRVTLEMGVANALVLGTSVTMRADNYPELLRAAGIAANALFDDATIDGMQRLIDTEFYEGATASGRDAILAFCRAHVPIPDDTAVLLACTELPLAFPEHCDDAVFESDGFRFVNTTVVHAEAALRRSLGSA